jgi:putative membrane protein
LRSWTKPKPPDRGNREGRCDKLSGAVDQRPLCNPLANRACGGNAPRREITTVNRPMRALRLHLMAPGPRQGYAGNAMKQQNPRHFPLLRVACASLGLVTASAFAQSTTPSTPPTDSPATIPTTPSNPSRSSDTYVNPTNPSDTDTTRTAPGMEKTDRSTRDLNDNRGVAVTPNEDGETESPRKIRNFFAKASMIDAEERRLSEVAVQRATNPQVKAFAQMLVTEHQAASQELQQLAQSKNVMLPTGKSAEEAADEAEDWNDKDAEEFDEDYVEKMIDYHKEAVDLYKDTAEDSEDPELAAFARKHLPRLQEHLRKAQELEKAID